MLEKLKRLEVDALALQIRLEQDKAGTGVVNYAAAKKLSADITDIRAELEKEDNPMLEKIKRLETKADGIRQAFPPDTTASAYLTELLGDIREIRADLEAAGVEGEGEPEPLSLPTSERKQIRETLQALRNAIDTGLDFTPESEEAYRNALLLLDTEPVNAPELLPVQRAQVMVMLAPPSLELQTSWVAFFNRIVSEVDIPPA